MAELTIDQFRERVATLGAGEFRRRLGEALTRTALEIERGAKINASGEPRVRTGRLRSSIRAFVTDQPLEVRAQAGGRADDGGEVRYAAAQEFGGTVRAGPGRWLRTPLAPALTGAGVDRYAGNLRTLAPDSFRVWPSKDGRLFLWKVDEPGEPEPWYRLVKTIKISRSLFLGQAVEGARATLPDDLGAVFRLSLEQTAREG